MNLNFYHVYIVWFAGLVRGAIAFGLILSVDGPNKNLIKITCLSLVLITMMLFGGVMPKYISILLPWAKRDDQAMKFRLSKISRTIK
jgi:sodium/hydrogen exchanger-like protein 6/7/sodium/hydrogen exchanger 8